MSGMQTLELSAAWGPGVSVLYLARLRQLSAQTNNRSHWSSLIINWHHRDMDQRVLGVSSSSTCPRESRFDTTTKTDDQNASGGSTPKWDLVCASVVVMSAEVQQAILLALKKEGMCRLLMLQQV